MASIVKIEVATQIDSKAERAARAASQILARPSTKAMIGRDSHVTTDESPPPVRAVRRRPRPPGPAACG
ncbi:hypothetical protein EVAR_17856_1 [Eumeta japonica]|uniref:Uncharacterized protein n=1 Tax=Eumeta variegata TaxID=151549 RepID=A0A4C1TTQ2_EUMVA|nr:hypothetical protein EVAR_17856_1 [Eumeta japonica]